jgi:adenylate cyclase
LQKDRSDSQEEESQYDSFEFIDLAGRDMQTIPIFLHLHAHNIIILNISRNPMTDIPLDFVQACTALKEIRMSNMALKRVPPSIRTSTSLARLDVSSNRIADLESVPLHEITTLLSLKVQNNKLTSIPSYFAQIKSLKYLNISNNKFEAFPEVVCEMSNLVDLDVSFNNIASLPAAMSDLKSLEKLAVFGNDISSFPSSFSNLANLRELDVRRNKLTDLSAVYTLPNLTRLQADWNNIVTLDAQLGAKVKAFSVQHNSITRFTLAPLPGATAVTYSLTHLNLSHAKISTLADEAFSGLVNLVDLNLNFNQFTQLPSTLGRLTNLEILSCTDNALNDLPTGWAKMTKLRILNLHNNNLRQILPELWLCPLESINLSSNIIQHFEDFSDDVIAASTSLATRKESVVSQSSEAGTAPLVIPPAGITLRRMYLADNQVTDEVFHHIARMPNLQILNLSFNDIYEVPHGTLSNNQMLEALYLSGNKLTSLPSEDLEKLQRLKILHLNGNKLQTLPSELGAIKTLQHLDVGSNVLKYNIANWPYDWNW